MWLIVKFFEALLGRFSSKDSHALTDEVLIERYLSTQDEFLFSILYHRYSTKIYAKCITMLKNMEVAQDCTHDIFIKVLTNIAKFNQQSKFSSWLFSITYNHCIDFIRKSKKSFLSDIPLEKIVESDEISDAFLMETKIGRLKKVLSEMDEGEKTLLLMKYQDELSIKEIGDILGKEDSATKMRIKRAKQRFKQIYDEHYKNEKD
ncbi:MAG: sigma-70 family RNA polymerase sigma factor [Saprospiraceae bacterium]